MTSSSASLSPASASVSFHPPWVLTVTLTCVLWATAQWLAQANLDSYHDMLENVAWAQYWDWGTHKHPPFFAWVPGLWFSVFPQNDFFYRLLSYTNVAVGLWGVWVLARRLGLAHLAATAVLLLLWSFPYTNLAGKFNANSQLLSVWPWTAAFLLISMQERGHKGLLSSIALGLLAAACMLSKYYSGVFLASLLAPSLLHPEGRRWLLSYRPYLALAVFGLALLPHLQWMAARDWVTLGYALDQGSGGTNWRYVARFALAPLFYWFPSWLACVLVMAYFGAGGPGRYTRRCLRAARQSWMPTGWDDRLFWLAFLPWAMTLAFGIAGVVELSTPWAIPIGFAFSLLWLRNLTPQQTSQAQQALQALWRGVWPMVAVVIAIAVLVGVGDARNGKTDYYRPSADAARAIVQTWQHRHPNQPLRWVGGEWAENALVGFYALPHVRTLPGLPDGDYARVYGYTQWTSEAGLLLCPRGPHSADGVAPRSTDCEQNAIDWLQAQGRTAQVHVLSIQRPRSWRFPRPLTFDYAVLDVLPSGSADNAASALPAYTN